MGARLASVRAFAALVAAIAVAFVAREARGQVLQLDGRAMVFHEPAPGSTMTVYTPSTDLSATPWEFLKVSAGWEADIVSGASERLKAGPVFGRPDVISAASVHDTRNLERGSVTITRELSELTVGGSTSNENDYKSRSLNASAKTDLFEHDTELEISYARNWDTVCDRAHAAGVDPTLRLPLSDSKGCFSNAADRSEQPIRTDSYQASWTQAWTPVFSTQVVYTGQLQHGFLSDPYRAVVLSPAGQSAQEHHPDDRARSALALRGNWFVKPLKGALRLGIRGYRDTWGIDAGNVDLEAEKYLASWLRMRLRGRYYRQSGALFWSDDYTGGEPDHGPRGQYWSGDRELSPFSSWMFGARAIASFAAGERRMLGVFRQLDFALSGDVLLYSYADFTLAGEPVQDTKAYIGSLSITAMF